MALDGVEVALDLVCIHRSFSLETDFAYLLDSESLDMMLLTALEYDLVMGLGSLKVLGLG